VLATGVWQHILVTWDGVTALETGLHIYKNGIEVSYGGHVHGANHYVYSGDYSLGGTEPVDNYNFDGKMAQVGVWNRVLTPTEIANLAAGYSPDLAAASGLQFYFKGNTASLTAVPGGLGVADGTAFVSGAGNGPPIIYP
jgi:hypothetical protein